MTWLFRLAFIPCFCIALSGCGGGSDGAAADPFKQVQAGQQEPGNSAGSTLSYAMTLSATDSAGSGSTVGPNSTVTVTAVLKDGDNKPVANQRVTFVSDPASPVDIDEVSALTDSNGKAVVLLRAPDISATADVILIASAHLSDQTVTAISIFKILRSSGNIVKFITTKAPTDPDGTLNSIDVEVEAVPTPAAGKTLLQLIPFQVLDLDNNPRFHVPVSISVYSSIGCPSVYIDSPETVAKTVTTDDNGIGIFNIGIPLDMPAIGDKNSCSVIYKAVAPDFDDPATTIYSYGGLTASITNKRL